jgi:hypothetical protein
MASLTGGDVQSDMPLPGITPQALPQRDRIASMLSGGSAALGGPQESAFPPPDQTRLPQLAALQASPDALTSPREAAGNRPIVVPDIAPQPAPQQMAQATMTRPQPLTPQPTPPTQAPGVYDKPIPPDVPKPVPLGPQEQYWKDLADKNEGRGGDPASTAFYRNKEKVYADQRAKEEARNTLQYQSERTLHDQRYRAWEDAQRNFGKTQAETAEAQAKALEAKDAAQITERTGLPAKQVTDKFDVLKKGAEKDAYTIQQLRLAREALDRGIVSGIGGEFRLNMERAKAFFGNKPADELAARSQLYLAAVNSTVGNALQNLQPGDTRVTNSDVIVARGMMGGDPSLQKAAQEKLLGVQMGDVHKRLNEYEGLKDKYLGGLKPEKFYDVQVDPVHANPEVAKAWVDKLIKNQDNYAARERFDKEFGPGAAELEISRARRRSRLGQ